MPLLRFPFPPQDREQLWWTVRALFGVTIPRVRVCPDHCAPFDAFADAYFRVNTIRDGIHLPASKQTPLDRIIIHASRGLAGKSKLASILGMTFAYLDGADITILGGSMTQSANVHEYCGKAMESPNLPVDMTRDHTATKIMLTNAARLRPLPASPKTARSPHPSILFCDEADEMDLMVYDAAMGQPMPQENYLGVDVPTLTIVLSTWQYPTGTFTEILRRAAEDNEPIYRWCVAEGQSVTTARGEVPIQEVTDADLVLTRQGWRHVQHVTFMGNKHTLSLDFGDRQLRCTPDHLIATPDGWRAAGALAADAMAATGPNPSVLGCELVPLAAVGGPGLVPPSTRPVEAVGDRVEVLDVHAAPVAAQVVKRQIIGQGSNYLHPYPAMSLSCGGSEVFQAVPVTTTAGPFDAASGEHGNTLAPVWDIGVEGAHEFVVNGIVVHNCYRESSNPVDGWLDQETIAKTRGRVSKAMWDAEYELGEPAIGDRAFDSDAVKRAFCLKFKPDDEVGEGAGYLEANERKDFEEFTFERYIKDATYVAGCDWAKRKDKTVIWVARIDGHKRRLVYFQRVNRRPYPVMIGSFNKTLRHYRIHNGGAYHDSTGLGDVVDDYVDIRARGFAMTVDKRSRMLNNYVNAIEKDIWEIPKIPSAYTEMLYCRVGDLYVRDAPRPTNKEEEFHLPDTVCAGALAEWAANKMPPLVAPQTVEGKGEPHGERFAYRQDDESPRSLADLQPPQQGISLVVGGT